MRDGRGRVHAVVSTQASPAAVRQHNLDIVLGVLDEAGIQHFCLPGADLRSRVAVPQEHRDDALRTLHALPQTRAQVRPLPAAGPAHRGPVTPAAVQVFQPVTDPDGTWVLGIQYRCDVEFWTRKGDELVSPGTATPNRAPASDPTVAAPARVFSRFVASGQQEHEHQTKASFATARADDLTFPIDVVYTWVDGADPQWRARKNATLAAHHRAELNELAANDSRYASRDELRYSLRSLAAFAPWVRHIYLVTDDQLPPWLDLSHPMITLVRHGDIFSDPGHLPTFNSHAIESQLHHIPGLAEHFLYFNDDMFLGRPVMPQTFFHGNGIAKYFHSPAPVDPGPATVHDTPVMAAGKNNRRHIQDRFGRNITQKMRHVPYPLRRSVLEEIETELGPQVKATASHQFRHPDDLSIPSSLAHYWAYLTGRSVPGSINYTYGDLGDALTPFKLARMLVKRNVQVFCLNDTDANDSNTLAQEGALLHDFLSAYFPFRAPFEYPEEMVRERARLSATELAGQAPQLADAHPA